MDRKVVITGIGSVLPTGTDSENLWNSIIQDNPQLGALESAFIYNTGPMMFGNISDDMTEQLSTVVPRELRKFCDNKMIWSISATEMAIKDSGIDLDSVPAERRGIFSSQGGYTHPSFYSFSPAISRVVENKKIDLKKLSFEINEKKKADPFVCIKSLSNSTLGINSIFKQFKGDCGSFIQNESGVIAALKSGAASIKHGYSDIALIIFTGSEKELFTLAKHHRSGHFNYSEDPGKAYVPYDEEHEGLVLGEGAVAVILESAGSAAKRSAPVYFELSGVESYVQGNQSLDSHNPYKICYEKVSENSSCELSDLDFIFAQGAGTKNDDRYELDMLSELIGDNSLMPIVNITPITGYIAGVSTAVNIIVSAMIAEKKVLPKITNLKKPMNSELKLLKSNVEIEDVKNTAIFGFNKQGFHSMILLSKPDAQPM